jgi:hypothetical protein
VRSVRVQRGRLPPELREQRGLCGAGLFVLQRGDGERLPRRELRGGTDVMRAVLLQRGSLSDELRFLIPTLFAGASKMPGTGRPRASLFVNRAPKELADPGVLPGSADRSSRQDH